MESLIEISKELGMVNTFSKWLYIISDTSHSNNNLTAMSQLIDEGNNIALAYNMTKLDSNCVVNNKTHPKELLTTLSLFLFYILQSGIKCHAYDIMRGFILGLSRMIREEKAVYGQISDEEWEVIRPTKQERRNEILSSLKVIYKQINTYLALFILNFHVLVIVWLF
jgi:glutamate receptor, ionotropic, invertebrate